MKKRTRPVTSSEALYGVAYALKFLLKKEQGMDYAVMPLEGLWWAPDMREFSVEHKETWLFMCCPFFLVVCACETVL